MAARTGNLSLLHARSSVLGARPDDILLRNTARGHDIRVHWIEQQYLIRHINPADVIFPAPVETDSPGSVNPTRPPPPAIDPQVGRPSYAGSYPPWTYFTSAPILVLPLAWLYPVYAALMVLSQAVICRSAWLHFRRWGWPAPIWLRRQPQPYRQRPQLSLSGSTPFRLLPSSSSCFADYAVMLRSARVSRMGGARQTHPCRAVRFSPPQALAPADTRVGQRIQPPGLLAVSSWLRQSPIALMQQFLQFGTRSSISGTARFSI